MFLLSPFQNMQSSLMCEVVERLLEPFLKEVQLCIFTKNIKEIWNDLSKSFMHLFSLIPLNSLVFIRLVQGFTLLLSCRVVTSDSSWRTAQSCIPDSSQRWQMKCRTDWSRSWWEGPHNRCNLLLLNFHLYWIVDYFMKPKYSVEYRLKPSR